MVIGKVISRYKLLLLWVATGTMTVALLFLPKEISGAVANAAELCVNVLLPSLFPFFVLSAIIIQTGLAKALGRFFEFLMRPLFHVPGSCAPAFILGILCGYPVGARTAISLYQNKLCSKFEAERLLAFCNNSGPAFILGSVGVGIWHNPKVGALLYFCHVAASLVTGILFRFYKRKAPSHPLENSKKAVRPSSLIDTITGAVKDSTMNMLYLCGFVIFFAVLIQLLFSLGIIPKLAHLLAGLFGFSQLDSQFFESLLTGALEITTGIKGVGGMSGSVRPRLALTGAMLGWAGLSIHCQVASFLTGSGLSAKPYIFGKLIQSAIAALFTAVACFFWPYSIPASLSTGGNALIPSKLTFFSVLSSSFSILLLCAIVSGGVLLVGLLLKKKVSSNRFHSRI